ncbi:MAG: HEPN domain-containing protein [Bacillota bacterium]
MEKRGFSFPVVMEFGNDKFKFVLPRDVHIQYIRKHFTQDEKTILTKWLDEEALSDEEYRYVIKKSFNQGSTKSLKVNTNESGLDSIIGAFGIKEVGDEENLSFDFIEDHIPQIKADTWNYIVVDILKEFYEVILKEYFPDNTVYLGAWKSEADEELQSLNTTLRQALMMTLFNYLYDQNAELYDNFQTFFCNEFESRAHLVKNIWSTREGPIKYIPIYDSFRNYANADLNQVYKILKKILDSEDLIFDEKVKIEQRLISQAKTMHRYRDPDASKIEADFLKPLVSRIVDFHKSEVRLKDAVLLFDQGSYDSAINRCYYSMMSAVRFILEKHNALSSWRHNQLSPNEKHEDLEKKFKSEIIDKNLLSRALLIDFRFVKKQRWVADYNHEYLDKNVCLDCINKTRNFVNEIRKFSV